MKRILLVIILLFLCGFYVGCNDTTYYDFYLDKTTYKSEDFDLYIKDFNESSFHNYNVSFKLEIISHNAKKTTYNIHKEQIYRWKDDAEFGSKWKEEFKLECDLPESTYFSWEIPTSCKDDQYYTVFKINGKNFRMNFHNK